MPSILCKYQGIESDFEIRDINDFILIIITPFQVQWILQFAHVKFCIDGMHGQLVNLAWVVQSLYFSSGAL